MSAGLVAGLPAPVPDALTVYCFGPAPGEAIVVALPGERWIVVDSCMQGGANVALLLLTRFGAKQLALAALTHPDADHYRGFTEILDHVPSEKVWVFRTRSRDVSSSPGSRASIRRTCGGRGCRRPSRASRRRCRGTAPPRSSR